MTTGSGSTDPRRKSPEKAAIRFEIQPEDLELITDITIANYNASTHTALSGRSPLDFIRLQLNAGRSLPRYAAEKSIDGLALFERDYRVTIRANSAQGNRPKRNRLTDKSQYPLDDYMGFLAKRALARKKARNQLINAVRITKPEEQATVIQALLPRPRRSKRSNWISIGIRDS